MDVLEHEGFEAVIEDKIYPRDFTQRGRIRVALKDPRTGEPKKSPPPTLVPVPPADKIL